MRRLLLTAVSLVALLIASAVPALAQAPFSTPPSEADVCAFVSGKSPAVTAGCDVAPPTP